MQKTFWMVLFSVALSSCATKNISIENVAPVFTPDLPGAPVAASPEDELDYQTLIDLQKNRTAADCKRGETEVKINLENLYGPSYGPLSASEITKWAPVFQEFSDLAWPLIGQAKDKWQRPRPFNAHSDITPCVKLEKSFSYPSGHAAMSRYYLHILEILKPDQKAAFEKRADQVARDRNLVGVHYPSDVRDGKVLGDEIYEFRKKDAKFQELLARARLAK